MGCRKIRLSLEHYFAFTTVVCLNLITYSSKKHTQKSPYKNNNPWSLVSFRREHTARVMETVRAINTGRSSKRAKKIGSHLYQSTSTPKNKAGFQFNPSDVIGEALGEGGAAVAQAGGNPGKIDSF